jgi:hypothetical protein
VVHAHILHIEWNADALVFCFVKSKGDQTGCNSNQEWHVYANPHNPKIYPVLALACYIFSNPGIFLAAADKEVVEGGEWALRKVAYSPEETSMTDSWTACTVFWQSILKSSLCWVSCLAIWDCTWQGKVQAAMLSVD